MKVGLSYITQIRKADDPETKAGFIAQTFNQLTAAVATGYHTEHNDDDTHGDVHARTLTVTNQPKCSAYGTALQSINSAAYTALTFDAEDAGTVGSMHNTVTNTSRFTIAIAGFYLVVGAVCYANSAVGVRVARVQKNGATILAHANVAPAGAAYLTMAQIVCPVQLVVGDYVELLAYQDTGGALNTGFATRDFANSLSVTKLV